MFEIRDAYQVLDEHATISSLGSFLENHTEKQYLEFIKSKICFAYPKTIWMRLGTEKNAAELKTRLSLPPELGKPLEQWFAASRFRSIVFDFRNVTMFDLGRLLEFLHISAANLRRYYLCDPMMAPLLIENGVDASRIYNSQPKLMQELRHSADIQRCNVLFPKDLSADSLDEAFIQHAVPERIESSDVVVFDMAAVHQINFEAAAMFTPHIYTLANKFGVLTCFTAVRRKVMRTLQDLGALRPVAFYIIGAPERAPAGLGSRYDTLPMHAFTDQQLSEVNKLCLQGTLRSLSTQREWVNPESRRSIIPDWGPSERQGFVLGNLLAAINEVIENVARHAKGAGYIMMQVDPSRGWSVYIGDSGVGLAVGLSRDYNLNVDSDLQAALLAFDLRRHREKRREPGRGFGGRGLTKVRRILAQLGGEIRLRTGSALALFSGNSDSPTIASDNHFFVQGTHYNFFIPTPEKL